MPGRPLPQLSRRRSAERTAAAPYLEEGPFTTPDVWRRLGTVFGGEFIGFPLWFN
jgi:hypothetical protein